MTIQQMFFTASSSKLSSRALLYGYDSTRYTVTGDTVPLTREAGFFPELTGSSYLTLFSATLDHNNTTTDLISGLNVLDQSGSTIGLFEFNLEPKDTADLYSVCGQYPYVGSTPNNGKYFATSYGTSSAVDTTGLETWSVARLKLENNDTYVNDFVFLGSTTSTTYNSMVSLTVPKTGYYILIATAKIQASSAASTLPRVRIWDGTTAYGSITNGYVKDVLNYIPYNHVEVLQLTASTTLSLQYAGDGTNSTTVDSPVLTILYIGTALNDPENMPNFYYATSAAQSTTTSTTFQSKASGTFTIANPSNLHLLIGSAHIGQSSTGFSTYAELINTSTSVDYNDSDWVVEAPVAPVSGVPQWYTLFLARAISFTQPSNTIAWRYRSEDGTATAYIKDANFCLIDLGIAA